MRREDGLCLPLLYDFQILAERSNAVTIYEQWFHNFLGQSPNELLSFFLERQPGSQYNHIHSL